MYIILVMRYSKYRVIPDEKNPTHTKKDTGNRYLVSKTELIKCLVIKKDLLA